MGNGSCYSIPRRRMRNPTSTLLSATQTSSTMIYHKSPLPDKNRTVLDAQRRLLLVSHADRSFVPQYNIEILSHDLNQEEECAICLEPFHRQEMVARLECLCIYHEPCLNQWAGKQQRPCPLHMDTSLAVHEDLRPSSAHTQPEE